MALGKCKECGRECAQSARVCPGCGVANPVRISASRMLKLFGIAVVGFFVLVGGLFAFAAASKGAHPADTTAVEVAPVLTPFSSTEDIQRKVATDAAAQHAIAKRNGSAIDACSAAMGVAAAYLQAKDEAHYAQWRQTQKKDCAAAGMLSP